MGADPAAPAPPVLHPADQRHLRAWCGLALGALVLAALAGFGAALEYTPGWAVGRHVGLTMQHWRPLHTAFGAAWLATAATAAWYAAIAARAEGPPALGRWTDRLHFWCWVGTGVALAGALPTGCLSGREYVGFPWWCGVPVLIGWGAALWHWTRVGGWRLRGRPAHEWMWSAGAVLAALALIEALAMRWGADTRAPARDQVWQWRTVGLMIGSLNLLLYGTACWAASGARGAPALGRSRWAFALFGVTLLGAVADFGGHTYHGPQGAFVPWVALGAGGAQLAILPVLAWQGRRWPARWNPDARFTATHAGLAAAAAWAAIQFVPAVGLVVPPLNALVHGTHVVVAHAMGCALGIHTMIGLGAVAYVLVLAGADPVAAQRGRAVLGGFCWLNIALLPFVGGWFINGLATAILRTLGPSAPPTYFERFALLLGWSGAAVLAGLVWLAAALGRAARGAGAPSTGAELPTEAG